MKRAQAAAKKEATPEEFTVMIPLGLQNAVISRAGRDGMTVDSWMRAALREKLAGKSMTIERHRKLSKIAERLGWAIKRLEELEAAEKSG